MKMPRMKILITGYKGFIGQNMVNALKDDHDLTLFEWGEDLPDFAGHNLCIHLGAISSTTETDIDKVLNQNYDFNFALISGEIADFSILILPDIVSITMVS